MFSTSYQCAQSQISMPRIKSINSLACSMEEKALQRQSEESDRHINFDAHGDRVWLILK